LLQKALAIAEELFALGGQYESTSHAVEQL
jgi:hypothetical protein